MFPTVLLPLCHTTLAMLNYEKYKITGTEKLLQLTAEKVPNVLEFLKYITHTTKKSKKYTRVPDSILVFLLYSKKFL